MWNKEGFAVGKRMNRLVKAMTALTMCLALSTTGMAASAAEIEVPDLNRKGSLSITFTYNGEPISDGNMVGIYKVADVIEDNGYKFVLKDEFSSVGKLPEKLDAENEKLSLQMTKIAADKKLKLYKSSQELDEKGNVLFEDLEVGLYLVVHTKKMEVTFTDKSKEKYTINPFLVSIPQTQNKKLIYDVSTNPKVSPEKETTPPPDEPEHPHKRVPQTGQLWWPVMAMGITGALFVTFGLVRKMKNR